MHRPDGKTTLIAIVILVPLALAAGIALVADSAWFKQYVAGRLSERVGHPVTIAGDIGVEWGSTTTLRLHEVRIPGQPVGPGRRLFEASRVDIRLDLPALLTGKVEVQGLHLRKPHLRLVRVSGGRASWREQDARAAPGKRSGGAGGPLFPASVAIDDGRVDLCDRVRDIRMTAQLHTTETPADRGGQARLTGEGMVWGLAQLHADNAAAETSCDASGDVPDEGVVRVQATFDAGVLAGTPSAGGRFRVEAGGPSPVSRRLGLAGDGFSLAAAFEMRPEGVHLVEIEAIAERSDLAGELTLRGLEGGPLDVVGRLHSSELHWNELRQPGDRDESGPGVPSFLREGSLDIDYRADTLSTRGVVGHDVRLRLDADAGNIRIELANGEVAGGAVTGHLRMQDVDATPHVELAVDLRAMQLADLFRAAGRSHPLQGIVAISGRLDATAGSLDAWLRNTNGELNLVMQQGRIEHLLLEKLKLEPADIAMLSLGEGESLVPVQCAAAVLTVDDGLARAKHVVLTTPDSQLRAEGTWRLSSGAIDMRVLVDDGAGPGFQAEKTLTVNGTISNLSVEVADEAVTEMVAEAVGAVALTALSPPLAAAVTAFDQYADDGADGAGRHCQRLLDDLGAERTGGGEAGNPAGPGPAKRGPPMRRSEPWSLSVIGRIAGTYPGIGTAPRAVR